MPRTAVFTAPPASVLLYNAPVTAPWRHAFRLHTFASRCFQSPRDARGNNYRCKRTFRIVLCLAAR
eukprot:4775405-Lingulodinium_polyedra.AAC.1